MNMVPKIHHLSELGVQIVMPKGPEAIWPAIRERKGKAFPAREIAKETGATVSQVENYLLRLERASLVAKAGYNSAKEAMFQVAAQVPHLAPVLDRKGDADHTYRLTEDVWLAARMLKTFNLTVLYAHLDGAYSREAVRRYLHELEKAGYIIDMGSAVPCGEKQWKLKPAFHNAGPYPPRPMMARFLYDPNRQAVTNRVLEAEEVRL